MHIFIPKLSKSKLIFLTSIFHGFFISFFRRHWYLKKRFGIPMCIFIVLIIAGIIIGSVLRARSKMNVTRTIFHIFFSLKSSDSSFHCTYIPRHDNCQVTILLLPDISQAYSCFCTKKLNNLSDNIVRWKLGV
jgi:hypothetical protein